MTAPDRVGWAIVGCGRVAERRVAPAIVDLPSARLAAVCSRSLSRARHFVERFGGAAAYDSLDALLADPGVKVVYLATPNALHCEQALRCLAAGKHVLTDKPMATNAADAARMVDAAAKAGRLLGVAHQQRYHPANMHLIRLVDESKLGRVRVIRVQIGMWLAPTDGWRRDPALAGGGALIDLGPHALDLMLEFGGDVRSVSGCVANLQFDGPEDFCCGRIVFASGAIGLLELGHCLHDYGGRVEVYGSEGTYVVHGSMQQAGLYQSWLRMGNEQQPVQEETYADCFVDALEDFTDSVLHGGDPSISMADGLRVIRVIDALYESARQGREIDLAK